MSDCETVQNAGFPVKLGITKRKRQLAALVLLFFLAHYLLFVILIKPGIIQNYGNDVSLLILAQAAAGVFVPLQLLSLAIFASSCNPNKFSLLRLIFRLGIFVLLMLLALIFFLTPEFKLIQLLEIGLIYFGFGLGLLFLNLSLLRLKIVDYWRTLIITILVFALITSILWLNPFFKSVASEPETFSTSINLAVNLNPAIVILVEILDINFFRAGNFYSQLGGTSLSVIGDYFGLLKFWGSAIFSLVFAGSFFLLYSLTFLRELFPKKKTSVNIES